MHVNIVEQPSVGVADGRTALSVCVYKTEARTTTTTTKETANKNTQNYEKLNLTSIITSAPRKTDSRTAHTHTQHYHQHRQHYGFNGHNLNLYWRISAILRQLWRYYLAYTKHTRQIFT